MPAHVTVLYPFVAPADLDDDVLATLAAIAGDVAPFAVDFRTTRWFDDQVVWLAPEPVQPFLDLMDAIAAAFPGHPPYGGIHDEVVPHVTVGEGADPAAMRSAEAIVRADLPVRTRATDLSLMVGSTAPATWHGLVDLPLHAG